jgi:orotate phosphoribosyltransferase
VGTLRGMSDPTSTHAALLQLLRRKSVRFGDFTLASGAKSDFYVDCRVTTMDAVGARLIGELGWDLIRRVAAERGMTVDAVGGLTMGADPVALAVAIASGREGAGGPLHAFAVRKTAKAHGLGRQIEGNFAAGHSVVVVDDVITTGGSTLQAIEAVEKEGGTVAFVMALVDREEGGKAAIEARGVPVYALATKSQLRAVAES